MWNWRQGRDTVLREARAGERRIDATEHWAADPPDPWEWTLDRRLLPSLQGEGMRGHPYRPVTLRDVPPGAAEDLGAVVGHVVAERTFVLPSGRRTTDRGGNRWVTTPTRVIAIGDDAIALWVDDETRPSVRAQIPFAEVLAVMDLNVLLLGRLEIVGEHDSFVVRYNAVNRPDLRDMLLPMRRSFAVMSAPPSTSSLQPDDLPFKWKGAVMSSDVQVAGPGDVVIAAGGLGGRRGRAHGGVAVLTSRELVIATDPTPNSKEAEYGFDTIAVPRSRVTGLAGTSGLLEIRIASNAPTSLLLTVDPELAAQILATLGPGVTSALDSP